MVLNDVDTREVGRKLYFSCLFFNSESRDQVGHQAASATKADVDICLGSIGRKT